MNKIGAYIAGLFLAALLMLLTIGLPITYSSVKKIKADIANSKANNSKSDNDYNPYSNSTEEKTPANSNTVNEEYVHFDHHDFHLSFSQATLAYIHTHEATYTAYHGELHCPPPNLLS